MRSKYTLDFEKNINKSRRYLKFIKKYLLIYPEIEHYENNFIPIIHRLLVYRIYEIGQSAYNSLNEKKWLSSALLTRAAGETMSILYIFNKKIKDVYQNKDIDINLEEFAGKIFLSSRYNVSEKDEPFLKATNIITYIEKVNKDIKFFKDSYELLSEYCHPNSLGLITSEYRRSFITKLKLIISPDKLRKFQVKSENLVSLIAPVFLRISLSNCVLLSIENEFMLINIFPDKKDKFKSNLNYTRKLILRLIQKSISFNSNQGG